MNNCCNTKGCNCSNGINTEYGICPECNSKSIKVKGVVVKRFVRREFWEDIKNNDIYELCTNPDCFISYFSKKNKVKFSIQDLSIPIWFKRDSTPKYACYCNKITFDMLRDSVIKDGLITWKDIVLKYRSRAICRCDILNPLGECCTKVFYSAINDSLISIGKPPVKIPDFCC